MHIRNKLNFVIDFHSKGKGELKCQKCFSVQLEFSFVSFPPFASKWPGSSDYRTPAVMWCQTDSCEPLTKGFSCMDFNIKVKPCVAGCLLLPSAVASSAHHPQQPEDLAGKMKTNYIGDSKRILMRSFRRKQLFTLNKVFLP